MSTNILRTRHHVRSQINLVPLAIATCMALVLAMAVYPEPITPLALAALPIAGLACYYFPVQVVVLAIAVSVFRLHEAYPDLGLTKLPLALGALALAAVFLHFIVLRTVRPYWNRALTYFALLLGCIFISTIFAENPKQSIDFITILYWKIILLIVGLAWLLRKPEHFDFAARIFVLSGIALAVRAIYNWINGIALIEGGRVTIGLPDARADIDDWADPTGMLSTLGDPNDLALYLILPLSFAVAMAVTQSNRLSRVFSALAAALILVAIIFTQSRGGLLGVAVLLATITYAISKSRLMLLTSICIGGLLLLTAISFSGRVSGVSESAIERGIDESAQGRIDNWVTAFHMAVKRPLVGVGINNFMDSYYRYSDTPRRRDKAVHSIWFQVIGELGFFGFSIFTVMFATLIKMVRSNHQIIKLRSSIPSSLQMMSLASMGALAGFIVAGSFLTQAFYWPLNIVFALVVATTHAIHAHALTNGSELKRHAKLRTAPAMAVSHFTYSDPKSVKTKPGMRRVISPDVPSATRRRVASLKAQATNRPWVKHYPNRKPKGSGP
jgi:O-antigen ligase